MNDTVFVLGNGTSRKNIDIYELPGLVIGCNACYRDFKPDVICAIDAGVISDIIDSGFDGDCYFTHDSWNLLSATAKPSVSNGSEYETTRKEGDDQFVFISGLDGDVKKTQNYIIWVPKKMEHKIKNMNYVYCREGQSTGTAAVYVACRDFNPKKVYLLGFDHKSNKYDNLYANTPHYYKSDHHGSWGSIHRGWTKELLKIMTEFPNIEFYWVNYGGYVFSDGAFQENLHFLDEKEIWQL